MLKDLKTLKTDALIELISDGVKSVRLQKGFYTFALNFDFAIWGGSDFERSYDVDDLPCPQYGVVDTPQQFIDRFAAALEADERPFVVAFTHHPKCPGETGGWRWHKWGEYIGDGNPTCEYLDDEELFPNGVYTYHVYLVDNVETL